MKRGFFIALACVAAGASAFGPFKFLGANRLVDISDRLKSRDAITLGARTQIYSFRTNYQNLILDAKRELLPLGWKFEQMTKNDCQFHFGKTKEDRTHYLIGIHNNRRAIPNGEQGYLTAKGWVTVGVFLPLKRK